MAAYRYWRIVVTAQPHANLATFAEVEFRTSVGGADVTGSGTASASSVYSSPTYTADKAFDNNSATYWCCSNTSPFPHWLQYDFGAGNAQEIVEYVLTGYAVNAQYIPTAWYLLASNDGVSWIVVDSKANQTWTAGQTKTFLVDTPLTASPYAFSAAVIVDSSHYRILSTVDRMGVPGKYPVRLYERPGGTLLRETKSAASDGAYRFDFLPYAERGYMVVALDDPATRSDPKNAAVADLMTPEAMP